VELAELAFNFYRCQLDEDTFADELTSSFASTYPAVQHVLIKHLKASVHKSRPKLKEDLSTMGLYDKARMFWVLESLVS
jgi:hypothetical protein